MALKLTTSSDTKVEVQHVGRAGTEKKLKVKLPDVKIVEYAGDRVVEGAEFEVDLSIEEITDLIHMLRPDRG